MSASDQDLAGLPENVRTCATPLHELLAAVPKDARVLEAVSTFESTNHPVGRLCHEASVELLRLASENAELHKSLAVYVHGNGSQALRAERAEAELATARETIKRLNRRVQVAEAGVAQKVKASAPGSFGRGLANAAADMFMHERDEAQAELAALKLRIAGSVELRVGDPAWSDGSLSEMEGVRVALLPRSEEH